MMDHYPSRTPATTSWSLLPRREASVCGVGGADWLRDYANDGYAILPGCVPMPILRPLQSIAVAMALEPPATAIREPDGVTVRSIFGAHLECHDLVEIARNPLLLELVRIVLGPDVYLHQSRINYKAGLGSTGWAWHSDFETWHVEDGMPGMRAMSIMIPLASNTEQNGPLLVVPGSHEWFVSCPGETPENNYGQHLQDQKVGIPDSASLVELIDRGDGTIHSVRCEPGDAVLFDVNLMHGSNSNVTPWSRTNLFFVYNHWDNRVVAPFCGRAPRPEHIASRASIAKL